MLVWALCFWTLAGCDSYLDVNPKGTLEQEKQFEDVQGYRDAMYGIYATMAKTSLYGEALSWGFVDWLAQLSYDKYMQSEKLVNVKAANQYKYDDPNLEGLIGSIWGEAYQCISYLFFAILNTVISRIHFLTENERGMTFSMEN